MITEDLDILKQISDPFDGSEEELQSFFDCLDYELSRHKIKGTGLSGIQINIPYQIAIIRIEKKFKQYGEKRKKLVSYNLYNAEILDLQQEYVFKGEGCLSIPGKFVDTIRYNNVTIKNGDGKILKFSGFEAAVVQHEFCHWQGVTLFDSEI